MNKKIAIIGYGHIGKALEKGLLLSGIKQEDIFVSNISEDNRIVAERADWIILAVKPSVVGNVITTIKDVIIDKVLFSVACGVTIAALQKASGNPQQKIIRLMPNIPVAYGKGVIGFFGNNAVSDEEKRSIIAVLSSLGTVILCQKEEHIDAMTILSGSGPAVVAYCLSLFEKAGQSFGFAEDDARNIAYQTFVGTLEVLSQTQQTAQELQTAVATKGGTTEAILTKLEEEHITSKFQNGFDTGYARIKEIKNNEIQ